MIVPARTALLLAWTALLVIAASASHAAQYPTHQPVPGGIARIELGTGGDAVVEAKFGRRQIMTLKEKNTWIGVVGINLDTPLGNYVVTVKTDTEDTLTRGFTVIPHSYPFKTSKEMRLFEPDKLPDGWRPTLDTAFPLLSPVEYASLEHFGTRYAEGQGIVPVRCVVLGVPGTADVKAPGTGIIYEIKEDDGVFYITIDHGMSLYSTLGPLKRVTKKTGQSVDRGEVVGEYDSERSEYKSLNWKTVLNGVNVNPLLFTDQADTPTD